MLFSLERRHLYSAENKGNDLLEGKYNLPSFTLLSRLRINQIMEALDNTTRLIGMEQGPLPSPPFHPSQVFLRFTQILLRTFCSTVSTATSKTSLITCRIRVWCSATRCVASEASTYVFNEVLIDACMCELAASVQITKDKFRGIWRENIRARLKDEYCTSHEHSTYRKSDWMLRRPWEFWGAREFPRWAAIATSTSRKTGASYDLLTEGLSKWRSYSDNSSWRWKQAEPEAIIPVFFVSTFWTYNCLLSSSLSLPYILKVSLDCGWIGRMPVIVRFPTPSRFEPAFPQKNGAVGIANYQYLTSPWSAESFRTRYLAG